MFDIFLQIDSTGMAKALAVQKESVMGLLVKGGILMIPLAILFALAIFFFIERLIAIRKASNIEDNFMSIIRDHVVTGNVTAARSLAKNTPNPVAKMIDKGLQRIGKPLDAIEKSMDNVGKLEIYTMEKNLPVLSVIARIAPLFGFVGTIIGLANALGYTLIAEGVETKEQALVMHGLGCHIIQGFFFSKPVASDNIPALLKVDFTLQKDIFQFSG